MQILLLIIVSVLTVIALLALFGLIFLRVKVRGVVNEQAARQAQEQRAQETAEIGAAGREEATGPELREGARETRSVP